MVESAVERVPILLLLISCLACEHQTSSRATASGTGPTIQSVCTFSIAVGQTRFNQFGGNSTLLVTASLPICGWELLAPGWVHLDRSAGAGSAELGLTIPPYALAREGAIQVGTRSVAIRQDPDGEVGALRITARCSGPFRAGTYAPLACYIVVEPGNNPTSTVIDAFADLRGVGGLEHSGIARCPACGEWGFDLDVRFPSDLAPGVKTIPILASDSEGRTAAATATIDVLPR